MQSITPMAVLADFESFVAVAFMVIAFVGWIVNLIGQSQPGAKPNPRRPNMPAPGQGGAKSVQSEIDKFLAQARQGQSGAPQRKDERLNSDGVEVIQRPRSAPPARRAPPDEKRHRSSREIWEEQVGKNPQARPQSAARKQPAQGGANRGAIAKTTPPRPAESRPERTQKSQRPQAGSGINTEASRFNSQVAKDLTPQMAANVQAHLGTFRAADPKSTGEQALSATTENVQTRASQFAQLLRSKRGMREAIIMGEIMTKPRALRRN